MGKWKPCTTRDSISFTDVTTSILNWDGSTESCDTMECVVLCTLHVAQLKYQVRPILSEGGLHGQDDREVKRLRRKQSNRESARRSRLRKQAECESLSGKVEDLLADNVRLREANRLLQARVDALTAQQADAVLPLETNSCVMVLNAAGTTHSPCWGTMVSAFCHLCKPYPASVQQQRRLVIVTFKDTQLYACCSAVSEPLLT